MTGYAIFGIILLLLAIWMAAEIYTAPVAEETEEEGFKILKPGRKLSDLFKRKSK